MKNLIFASLLAFIMGTASAQENQSSSQNAAAAKVADPNKEIKEKYKDVTDYEIRSLCINATELDKSNPFPKYATKISELEIKILRYEGFEWEEDLDALVASDGMEAVYEIIRNAWNEKWSKIYCTDMAFADDAYLDHVLFMRTKFRTLYNIYAKQAFVEANQNRYVPADANKLNEPVTFLDMMNTAIENNQAALMKGTSQLEDAIRFRDSMIENGAKTATELQPYINYHTSLGIDWANLYDLCKRASGKTRGNNEWGLISLEEYIYELEDIDYSSYENPSVPKSLFSKAWNERYSKCFCLDEPGTYLDNIAYSHNQMDIIDRIYSPVTGYTANINRIWVSNDLKGTFLDYVYLYNDSEIKRYEKWNRSKKDLKILEKEQMERINLLRGYGAKKISELE